jgi:DNA sulfur modification protein DndD
MYNNARPELEKAERAQKISKMLGEVVAEALPMFVGDLAAEMTAAYKDLAHKQIVERVDIDEACNVRLLMRNGQDVRDLDSSAGENQIFSFALISAIARAANIQFPLVIDTPLARLDEKHRLNVLQHFCDRAGEQVILLSQDTEVVDEYLDAIRDRVAKTFLIEHRKSGDGIGKSTILPDKYFL